MLQIQILGLTAQPGSSVPYWKRLETHANFSANRMYKKKPMRQLPYIK
jgi:hypothetical protein